MWSFFRRAPAPPMPVYVRVPMPADNPFKPKEKPVNLLEDLAKTLAEPSPLDKMKATLATMPYGDFMEFCDQTGAKPADLWAWATGAKPSATIVELNERRA